jgi:predicted dehydrogenase
VSARTADGLLIDLAAAEVELVGVVETNRALIETYTRRFNLSSNLFFASLDDLFARTKVQLVATFTSTFEHRAVVERCAREHVDVMMEKPLAVNMKHARAIEAAAKRGGIQVFVNYETTWYPSHGAMWNLIKERKAAGEIRKMVAMDGHSGPKAINVQPEFLAWLSDPVRNGGGALFDFGCYGANLMTWMMDNQRPLAVTAVTQHFQPAVYQQVDDEATILVEYPTAQGIIQASWNWPFNRKDFEVYGDHGLAIATGGSGLRVGLPKEPEHAVTPEPLAADERDSISHLRAVVRGTRQPNALSSLENNLIATEILEAARESARTQKRVTLQSPGK